MDFKKTIVKLDKERQLKWTLRGINEFEQVTGINITEVNDLRDLSPREIYALIWACLIWQDKELKLEDVPILVNDADMTKLLESLIEAINNSLPEVKAETVPLAETKPEPPLIGSELGVLQSTILKYPRFLS